MPNQQTLLFTVMPRALTFGRGTLPISVFVSPRLIGDPTLASYPDWRHWTQLLQSSGLRLQLAANGTTQTLTIDRSKLQPALWEALFADDTLVNRYAFDDYSGRGFITFSVRRSLSALKAIYQHAGITLALPSGPEQASRRALRDMVQGLAIHWGPVLGQQLRDHVRVTAGVFGTFVPGIGTDPSQLDPEGLIVSDPDPNANQAAALPFAVFHHMPTPPGTPPLAPDWSKELDFHQALSAVNGYPLLQRALGLVFDFDLPPGSIPSTTASTPGALSIVNVQPEWDWHIPTTAPPLQTAYIALPASEGTLFLTAPRTMVDSTAPNLVLGLLSLDPGRFGLAQVDVDGAMHKAIMLAETLSPDADANRFIGGPAPALHPEVFDHEATVSALRSGGLTLYADGRVLALLDTIAQNKAFNDGVQGGMQPRPFYAEDLARGWRLDIWDSHTNAWHSLHARTGTYQIADQVFGPVQDEGFVQLAATQPAPGAQPATTDIYVHEAIARWPGWSLSAPRPGKHLSRYADPDKAIPPDTPDPEYAENEPVTPFKLQASFKVVAGTLPQLRFGRRYRIRARAVDLAGNSMSLGDNLTDLLSQLYALPQDPEGFAYLRYEPVAAPLVVIRDPAAITDAGSAVYRLVIRTLNTDPAQDTVAADLSASDRHILPPRAAVEICEHHGLFDDASGRVKGDAATWTLIGARDGGELPLTSITVAGKTDNYPLITDAVYGPLPYLLDPLAHGAALRNLPGTAAGTRGDVSPGAGAAVPVAYHALSDPNPRPGSATLVSFGPDDWQQRVGFRLALAEPPAGTSRQVPSWDPANRVLTVYLPKATLVTVPLTGTIAPDDLPLMGVWQWLRQYIERVTVTNPAPEVFVPGGLADRIAHVLQLAVEGGHWMLTPPRLLTLVHAVQQPLGGPAFVALDIAHPEAGPTEVLQTAPISGRTDPTELATITAWRAFGAPDAYLIGGLKVHGASTAKIDIAASWTEPVDDPSQPAPTTAQRHEHVEEIKLVTLSEGYIAADAQNTRLVGYYHAEHDQIAFVREGDTLGIPEPDYEQLVLSTAAPRHFFGDTKHRRIHYTATATSRFREYFDPTLVFTRDSGAVSVDVPASARPVAPQIRYVLPTFGWERQTGTNLKRSVRFGGGLRVYLERPWYSSGEDELLGVALWSTQNGTLDRDRFKPYMTQWGMDPIWTTADLSYVPQPGNFPDAAVSEPGLPLEEASARAADGSLGFVDVAGFAPQFDSASGLWFADLTINTFATTYAPFVRLALVRYQPHALVAAKISRVVLADFAQLTPDRAAMVTADPFHPRTVRVVVSGLAPQGPAPVLEVEPAPAPQPPPTQITVGVQKRDPSFTSDVAWSDAPAGDATVQVVQTGAAAGQPDLTLFVATVTFAQPPQAGEYRLLIEEREYVSADHVLIENDRRVWPGRLIYAETFAIDAGLAGGL
jgi:hypothetical protein